MYVKDWEELFGSVVLSAFFLAFTVYAIHNMQNFRMEYVKACMRSCYLLAAQVFRTTHTDMWLFLW